MTGKVSADELRDKSIKEIQRFINDQKKKKRNIFCEQPGSKYPAQPSESVGTVKRNIARAKTVMNERMSENN